MRNPECARAMAAPLAVTGVGGHAAGGLGGDGKGMDVRLCFIEVFAIDLKLS
jgi:hypothetical protein